MSITTRAGDKGMTKLMYGRRVSKTHPRMITCGVLDELNSALGMARANAKDNWTKEQILFTQKDLIAMMGEIATDDADREKHQQSSSPKLNDQSLKRLDDGIIKIEKSIPRFKNWVIPGENTESALLDWTRSVCRRAEQQVAALAEDTQTCWLPLNPLLIQYLNRLSDFLWLLARQIENHSFN